MTEGSRYELDNGILSTRLHLHVNIESQMLTAVQVVFLIKRAKFAQNVGLAAPNRMRSSCLLFISLDGHFVNQETKITQSTLSEG
jgi:hypothetical protein